MWHRSRQSSTHTRRSEKPLDFRTNPRHHCTPLHQRHPLLFSTWKRGKTMFVTSSVRFPTHQILKSVDCWLLVIPSPINGFITFSLNYAKHARVCRLLWHVAFISVGTQTCVCRKVIQRKMSTANTLQMPCQMASFVIGTDYDEVPAIVLTAGKKAAREDEGNDDL